MVEIILEHIQAWLEKTRDPSHNMTNRKKMKERLTEVNSHAMMSFPTQYSY